MTRSLCTYARVLLISCAARIVFTKMKANSYASLATYLKRTSIRLLPTDATSRASANGTCSAVGRWTDVESLSSVAAVSIAGLIPITALQWAGSCAPSRSSEPPHGMVGSELSLKQSAATSDLADKALKWFQIAWYTPSSICRDGWAKSSAGSGIGAIWFAG